MDDWLIRLVLGASLVTAASAALGLPLPLQLLVFATVSTVGVVLTRPIALLTVFTVPRVERIVPQARARNVERLGRYHRTLQPGLNFVIPYVDRVHPKIDLREQVVSFQPQPVITEDNPVVEIDAVLHFQVTDPVPRPTRSPATYRPSSTPPRANGNHRSSPPKATNKPPCCAPRATAAYQYPQTLPKLAEGPGHRSHRCFRRTRRPRSRPRGAGGGSSGGPRRPGRYEHLAAVADHDPRTRSRR